MFVYAGYQIFTSGNTIISTDAFMLRLLVITVVLSYEF